MFARGSLKKLWRDDLDADEAVRVAVEALYDAADDDSATGGPDLTRGICPVVATVDRRRLPARARRRARGDRASASSRPAAATAARRSRDRRSRVREAPTMSMPFYVSPEQLMKDRADYARKGIARGRSVVVCSTPTASLFVAENPSRALHKISEIYDRIAFAAVGKYNEFENLRVAGVRLRRPARLLLRPARRHRPRPGQRLRADARHDLHRASKPYEVEIVVAEVGRRPPGRPDLPAHLRRLGRRRARLRRHGRPGRAARRRLAASEWRRDGHRRCRRRRSRSAVSDCSGAPPDGHGPSEPRRSRAGASSRSRCSTATAAAPRKFRRLDGRCVLGRTCSA